MFRITNNPVLKIIIAVLVLLCWCSNFGNIETELGFSVQKQAITHYENSHGVFLGDGETVIVFTPTPKFADFIRKNWNKTPVHSEIIPLLFIGTDYNIDMSTASGYWIYTDSSPDALYSHNIAFAFFDGEKVVYYELDT